MSSDSKEEVADETAGDNRLFDARRMEEVEWAALLILIKTLNKLLTAIQIDISKPDS